VSILFSPLLGLLVALDVEDALRSKCRENEHDGRTFVDCSTTRKSDQLGAVENFLPLAEVLRVRTSNDGALALVRRHNRGQEAFFVYRFDKNNSVLERECLGSKLGEFELAAPLPLELLPSVGQGSICESVAWPCSWSGGRVVAVPEYSDDLASVVSMRKTEGRVVTDGPRPAYACWVRDVSPSLPRRVLLFRTRARRPRLSQGHGLVSVRFSCASISRRRILGHLCGSRRPETRNRRWSGTWPSSQLRGFVPSVLTAQHRCTRTASRSARTTTAYVSSSTPRGRSAVRKSQARVH